MAVCTIEWDDRGPVPIHDLVALNEALDAIANEHPNDDAILVNVYVEGDQMTIGLGRDVSVVSFTRGCGEPPYWMLGGAGTSGVLFYYFGTWTEFEGGFVVPMEAARAAVARFVERRRFEPEGWIEL